MDNIQKYQLFSVFFIYSVVISLSIQFILLPYFFSEFYLGNGQMHGGDWAVHHAKATVLANNISEFGWEAWNFRPMEWGITGLISLHYGVFGINHPGLLIPLYSGLHALGAFCIFIIIEKLNVKRFIAILAVLPYLLFPSSLLWVSQILKDVFTLNSSIFILCGLILLLESSKFEAIKSIIKTQILSFILIFFGLAIICWIRPYMLTIYFVFILFTLILINFSLIISITNKRIPIYSFISLILAQFFIIFTMIFFNSLTSHNSVLGVSESDFFSGPDVGSSVPLSKVEETIQKKSNIKIIELQKIIDEKLSLQSSLSISEIIPLEASPINNTIPSSKSIDKKIVPSIYPKELLEDEDSINKSLNNEIDLLEKSIILEKLSQTESIKNFGGIYGDAYIHKDWKNTKFLPGIIDANLKKLYFNRSYFYQVAHSYKSSFDIEIYLNSFTQMLKYVPRALQIGLFSPFPNRWFNSSNESSTPSFFNQIIAVEMAIIYIFLILAIFSSYIWRKKLELWIMMSFSIYFILIPIYAFPNFGAIIRYRYAALMIIVAIGIAFFNYVYINRSKLNNNE